MIKVSNPVGRELKETFKRNEAVCARVIGLFQLFSNKGRFRIVCLLARGEFCVNEITEIVGGKASNISQQLKMLSLSGVIERRRVEQRILYSLKDQRVRSTIRFLQTQFLNGEGGLKNGAGTASPPKDSHKKNKRAKEAVPAPMRNGEAK